MKVPITEDRWRLPELVSRVKKDEGPHVQITVYFEMAAELQSRPIDPPVGAAAQRLRELMAELPAHPGRKRNISKQVNQHLYGKKRRSHRTSSVTLLSSTLSWIFQMRIMFALLN